MCKSSKSLLWLLATLASVQTVPTLAANRPNNGGSAAVRSKPAPVVQAGSGSMGNAHRIRNHSLGNPSNLTPVNLPNGSNIGGPSGNIGKTKRASSANGGSIGLQTELNPMLAGSSLTESKTKIPNLGPVPINQLSGQVTPIKPNPGPFPPINPGPFPPINPGPFPPINPGPTPPINPNPGQGQPGQGPSHPGHHGHHHHHFPWHHLVWHWAHPCPYPNYYECGTVCVNGQWVACSEPVAPRSVTVLSLTDESLVEIPVGATFQLPLSGGTEETGVALIRVRGLSLPVEILDWAENSIVLKLPAMGLNEKAESELIVLNSTGGLIRSAKFLLLPASAVVAK